MRTIILYGELAKRFGKTHRFAVKNAAEAIRALKANFKGFDKYMCNAHQDNVGFKIFVGGTRVKDYPETYNPTGQNDIIRIVPVLVGSGGNGWVNVLIGAVLIVAGVFVSGASFGAASPLGTAMISAGIGLAIGGVAQLISPPPKTPGTPGADQKQSAIFTGPVNVSAQGAAVPLGYGRMIVGSVVVSAGIETYEEQ